MIFTNGNKSYRLVEGSLGGVTSTTSFHNLQQLHQVLVITVLNGSLNTARSYGEEYLTRTHGLEGRL